MVGGPDVVKPVKKVWRTRTMTSREGERPDLRGFQRLDMETGKNGRY